MKCDKRVLANLKPRVLVTKEDGIDEEEAVVTGTCPACGRRITLMEACMPDNEPEGLYKTFWCPRCFQKVHLPKNWRSLLSKKGAKDLQDFLVRKLEERDKKKPVELYENTHAGWAAGSGSPELLEHVWHSACCPSCGATLSDGADAFIPRGDWTTDIKFCPYCGQRITFEDALKDNVPAAGEDG